jgi:hypothetical protein
MKLGDSPSTNENEAVLKFGLLADFGRKAPSWRAFDDQALLHEGQL